MANTHKPSSVLRLSGGMLAVVLTALRMVQESTDEFRSTPAAARLPAKLTKPAAVGDLCERLNCGNWRRSQGKSLARARVKDRLAPSEAALVALAVEFADKDPWRMSKFPQMEDYVNDRGFLQVEVGPVAAEFRTGAWYS